MAFTLDFCEARAHDAAQAAFVATLDNVRERELRSEAAWRAMSDQIRQVEEKRKERLESSDQGDSAAQDLRGPDPDQA